MAKCPVCKKEHDKAKKTWKYGQFKVQACACECGAVYGEYTRNNKHSFTLKKANAADGEEHKQGRRDC